ncbi:hypothetical protein CE91St30_20880 [Raoultibacter timonensis]|uniref:Uncharacterized protein n=1 Tax=Raoultibacter timonensis TaxID=1907662 RepID=A0ABN6MIF7_9ACTN|nr:hypothetical protein CE91St30_20880 [Raoultibacter timonensis]BDF51358.1 hypothetical protein CE91St31_20880 [Raoultibacter timonensis]
MPFPKEDTTPPVTNMCLVMVFSKRLHRTGAGSFYPDARGKTSPRKKKAPASIAQCFQTLFYSTRQRARRPHPSLDFTHWKHERGNRGVRSGRKRARKGSAVPEKPLIRS